MSEVLTFKKLAKILEEPETMRDKIQFRAGELVSNGLGGDFFDEDGDLVHWAVNRVLQVVIRFQGQDYFIKEECGFFKMPYKRIKTINFSYSIYKVSETGNKDYEYYQYTEDDQVDFEFARQYKDGKDFAYNKVFEPLPPYMDKAFDVLEAFIRPLFMRPTFV